jgi:NAD(P)-dependent dehydrogenase (short-subunit alcohol dehydrogenase family)
MTPRRANEMSEEPLLQSRTLSWVKKSELVVHVLSDFSSAQEILFNLAENTIRQGAIYDVTEDTKVEMMGNVELNGVYLCMHVNLRPVLLAELGDTRGRPMCLLEKDGMVVSGYFLKKPGECFGMRYDTRLINLSALAKSCERFLKR